MYKILNTVVCFVLLLFTIGCYYYIPKSRDRNLSKEYSIQKKPDIETFKKIDTTAFYVQTFKGRFYNKEEIKDPIVYIFHSDGYFKSTSVNNFKYSKKFTKNSTSYGGKYKLIDNKLALEKFYPSQGSKTSYYRRSITKAELTDSIITLYYNNNYIFMVLKKSKKLPTPTILR